MWRDAVGVDARDPRVRDFLRRDRGGARHPRRRRARQCRRLTGRAARPVRRRRAGGGCEAPPRARFARGRSGPPRGACDPRRRHLVAATRGPGLWARCSSASRLPRRWHGDSPFRLRRRPPARPRGVALLSPDLVEPPFVCLLATGGHTMVLEVTAHDGYAVLGRRSTMQPARRSTRARGCSGWATPAAPSSNGSHAAAIRGPPRSPLRG